MCHNLSEAVDICDAWLVQIGYRALDLLCMQWKDSSRGDSVRYLCFKKHALIQLDGLDCSPRKQSTIDMSGTDLNISVSTIQYEEMCLLPRRPAVDPEPSNPCTLLTGLLRRSQPPKY